MINKQNNANISVKITEKILGVDNSLEVNLKTLSILARMMSQQFLLRRVITSFLIIHF